VAEKDYYPEVEAWLNQYLKDKYKGYKVITTYEGHKHNIDVVLKKYDIDLPDAKGLNIEIDVIGILKRKEIVKLVFVEVKAVPLTLNHLGQLWGYCQLLNPDEAFLISPEGIGSLTKILFDLRRIDILQYGKNKQYKSMKVAQWDISRKNIDHSTLIE